MTSIFLRALLSITSWTESNQWLQQLLWGMESDYRSEARGRSLISSGNDLKLWKTQSKLRENCIGGITINFSRVPLCVKTVLNWTISQRICVPWHQLPTLGLEIITYYLQPGFSPLVSCTGKQSCSAGLLSDQHGFSAIWSVIDLPGDDCAVPNLSSASGIIYATVTMQNYPELGLGRFQDEA